MFCQSIPHCISLITRPEPVGGFTRLSPVRRYWQSPCCVHVLFLLLFLLASGKNTWVLANQPTRHRSDLAEEEVEATCTLQVTGVVDVMDPCSKPYGLQ